MSGEALISHLRSLDMPGVDQLEGGDYDWLFTSDQYAPLASFLQWFTNNISARDILTEAEIFEYEGLESRGEVLRGPQLEEMEACLSGLSSALAPSHHHTHPPLSPQEQERLENQLQLLTKRKDHLSLHKMDLREELNRSNKAQEEGENELRSQQERLLLTSHHHNNLQQEFVKNLDAFIEVYRTYEETPMDSARYLSQLDLGEWQEEETKFTHALKTYIRKQFTEGVRVLAGESDESEYCLLEPNNLELHLVRGEGHPEYVRNIQELHRITSLLRETEEWSAEGVVMQARRKAQIEEAKRALAAIQANQFPSTVTVLQKQVSESSVAVDGAEREVEEQWRMVVGLVGEVAQLEATTTISGNYQLKLQRQEYFLNKQNVVLDQLVCQLSRYRWVNMSLDLEREGIKDTLDLLHTFNTIMLDNANTYKDRMVWFEAMRKEYEEKKASGLLPASLQTLSQLLPPTPHHQGQAGGMRGASPGVTGAGLKKQVEALHNSLSVARELVSTAKNPHFSRLNRMTSNCDSLETSLFGNRGSLRTLPVAWLEPGLADRCAALDDHAWKLKYKLLDLLRQHDEKKKILQVDPTAREDIQKWTTRMIKALD